MPRLEILVPIQNKNLLRVFTITYSHSTFGTRRSVCYSEGEKGAFALEAPRSKIAGRQSSSVSVLLPTVACRGGAAGIDSWQSCGCLTDLSFGRPQCETSRPVLVK